MIQKTELSWATVNTADPREMAEFRAQQERHADERAKAAFERLKAQGIIDADGNSIGDELPPDMRSGAKRDFGGCQNCGAANCGCSRPFRRLPPQQRVMRPR